MMILILLMVLLAAFMVLLVPGAFIALVVYTIVKYSQQSKEMERDRAKRYIASMKFAADVHELLRAR